MNSWQILNPHRMNRSRYFVAILMQSLASLAVLMMAAVIAESDSGAVQLLTGCGAVLLIGLILASMFLAMRARLQDIGSPRWWVSIPFGLMLLQSMVVMLSDTKQTARPTTPAEVLDFDVWSSTGALFAAKLATVGFILMLLIAPSDKAAMTFEDNPDNERNDTGHR